MYDKSCLAISYGTLKGIPDYYPKNFLEAKKYIIKACKGKTSTTGLLGIHFRMDNWSQSDMSKFDNYFTSICDKFVKKHNGMKKNG